MTHLTRLDFAIGSAGLMRRALSEAIHHTSGAPRLPATADRPAADAERARRPRARGRGGDPARLPAGARGRRRAGRRCERRPAGAHRHAGRQVLELQARRRRRARGARMPWRQRLHRGRPDGAALSRGAAQRHLGGQRQHHRARRPARRRQIAGRACPPSSTRCGRPRAATGASTGRSTASRPSCASRRSTRRGRAASSRRWRSPCRRACSIRHSPAAVADAFCATRLDGDGGAPTAACLPASTSAPSSSARA